CSSKAHGRIICSKSRGRPASPCFPSSFMTFPASQLLLPLCLAIAFLTGCASPKASSKGSSLPALMVERLGWMDKVAQVKLPRSLPVTDPKREAELLVAMEKQGAQSGLPATAVRAFFAGQIESAKQYQTEWLKQHSKKDVPAESLPDLAQ